MRRSRGSERSWFPPDLPGAKIVETWDHAGLRASGSHDLVLEDVLIPPDYEIDVRTPGEWRAAIRWD